MLEPADRRVRPQITRDEVHAGCWGTAHGIRHRAIEAHLTTAWPRIH